MQSSLAELLSGIPGVDLDRKFLEHTDKVRAGIQAAVRELAENETREETPGQPYLTQQVLNALRGTISEGWIELHRALAEHYLIHPELRRVDADKLFGELAMLIERDANREWEEVTTGKFIEGTPAFGDQGEVIRPLIWPGSAAGLPMEFHERVVTTTESAKMTALRLKLDPCPAVAVAVTPDPGVDQRATETTPTWTSRINDFIEKVSSVEYRITRSDIDSVARYNSPRTRQNLEANKGRGTRASAENYDRVLRMTREQFLAALGR